jgi:hypothetical protein
MLNSEMIGKIWKKSKWNSEKDMKIMEETQVENIKDLEKWNSELIGKIQMKSKLKSEKIGKI